MTDPAQVPGHGPVAAFRVEAILATQAIAVYVELDRAVGPNDPAAAFERLPPRLRMRVLEACEAEFRRRREALIRAHPMVGGGSE